MPGYSGKPLWSKLGYREGMTVLAINAPAGYQTSLGELPVGVRIVKSTVQPYAAVHLFATSSAELSARLKTLRSEIAQDGMIWVSWPKKTAKMATDLSDNAVRDAALPLGLVDIKMCAVDDTWSGLKLMIRKSERK